MSDVFFTPSLQEPRLQSSCNQTFVSSRHGWLLFSCPFMPLGTWEGAGREELRAPSNRDEMSVKGSMQDWLPRGRREWDGSGTGTGVGREGTGGVQGTGREAGSDWAGTSHEGQEAMERTKTVWKKGRSLADLSTIPHSVFLAAAPESPAPPSVQTPLTPPSALLSIFPRPPVVLC